MLPARPATPEIELDLGRYELRRNGRRVKLEKKPMELLIFLVGRREQLVSRQDIVSKLWRSDLFVDTETSINNIVRKIRTALGDNSAKPRFLETVVGKGYRFIGPVRVVDPHVPQAGYVQSSGTSSAGTVEDAGTGHERWSDELLSLFSVGNIPDNRGLCLGFADALISRLGNLERMNVLPTSAVLNLPLQATTSEISSRLGDRFAAHGAIQISKAQSRLS